MSAIDSVKNRLARCDGPVAVLLGGESAEREISLQSGAAVLSALQQCGIEAVAVDTADAPIAQLQRLRPSFAFIALHGVGGEDGQIQAVLQQLSIPYSGSSILRASRAIDKVRSKTLWRGCGLSTPGFAVLTPDSDFDVVADELGLPLVVKPVTEGSSLGMSLATSVAELASAYRDASAYSDYVFAEQYIDGPEYTCAVLADVEMPAIRIETRRSFYDFDAKYTDNDTGFFIPSGLTTRAEASLRELARRAFDALGCSIWGRVDLMRDAATNDFFLLEVNTVPGLTDHSLVPMAAKAAGMTFTDLIVSIIEASMPS